MALYYSAYTSKKEMISKAYNIICKKTSNYKIIINLPSEYRHKSAKLKQKNQIRRNRYERKNKIKKYKN